MSQTDNLIEALASQLQPVRRMQPPMRRALIWLGVAGVTAAVLIACFARLDIVSARLSVGRIALETMGSALTAVVAIVAAFELSVPGHSQRWLWLPLPPLLLWLGASGAGCLRNGLGLHLSTTQHVPSCFVFILLVSLPLSVALFWMLRRARPIAPLPVASVGALGIAASSATVLEFFHPFDITWLDLGAHLSAVLVVIATVTALRERVLAVR